MANREKFSELLAINAFDIQLINTDTTTSGEIIDMQGFDSLLFSIHAGTITAGIITPVIEHGDASNLSDAADVPDVNLRPTEAEAAFIATDDNVVKRIAYTGSKRFVRIKLTTASSADLTVGVQAIQANAAQKAVAVNS